MIGNYFKIGYRILIRQKKYTLLNITGLAVGIAVFTFIFLYIQNEIRYDTQWTDYKNIYRVISSYSVDGSTENMALTPFRLAEDLKTKFPQVDVSTNMFFTDPSDINDISSVTFQDKNYEIPNITLSDNNFFKIFDYTFLQGTPDSALSKPNTMVISEKIAKEIFGETPAVGKKLSTVVREYTVVGVYEEKLMPTHHNFDAIVSVSSLDSSGIKRLKKDWYWLTCYTYFKVNDTVDIDKLEFNFNEYANIERNNSLRENFMDVDGYFINIFEPLTDIHFNTSLQYDSPSNINSTYLYIFGIIAAFILLTASINYINLATARSLKRAKEIGVRKVLGASKKQLIFHYISESLIITFISFFLAMSLVELLMPQFNDLIGVKLTLVGSIFSGNGLFFGIILVVMVFMLAIIGGSFPAFLLSSITTASVIKGDYYSGGAPGNQYFSAGLVRKFLVTIQYIVSIGMIISTFIIYSQIQYLNTYNLGFNQKNILVINSPHDTTFEQRMDSLLYDLKLSKAITEVSSASNVPGYTEGKMLFYVGDTSDQNVQALNYYRVGNNYFELLEVPLIKGNHFSSYSDNDSINKYIINEAAARYLHLDTIVGTKLSISFNSNFRHGIIVGLVKNFNFSSLHNDVDPLVFLLSPKYSRYLLVKFNPNKKREAQLYINKVWKKYNKGSFLHSILLNKKLDSLYSRDKKMLSLFIYFSVFAIFISSIGLYGLTSFLIQQRTKEIGIRKILGGSEPQIITMLIKGYLRIVLTAGLIASIFSYLFISYWLGTFAYHIKITGWYFILGIIIAVFIAVLTVIIRSLKVVNESPSVSLNYSG